MFSYENPNAINLFTDASTSRYLFYDTTSVCSGFIAVHNKKQIMSDVRAFPSATSNFGELYAFFMAMNYIHYDATCKRLNGIEPACCIQYNIFSDSMYTISAVKSWLPKWLSDPENIETYPEEKEVPILYKDLLQENPVQHQECMMHILNTILSARVPINIYHIKAHRNYKSNRDVRSVQVKFAKKAKINIDDVPFEWIKDLMFWNEKVDKMTRNYLKQIVATPHLMQQYRRMKSQYTWPIQVFPSDAQSINQHQVLVR